MRLIIGTWLAITIGIFSFAAATGLTGSTTVAAAIGILLAALAAILIRKFSILNLEASAASRGLRMISTVAIIAALFQLARLTVFIVAPSQTAYSTFPSSKWEIRHSCLTAYFIAAQSAGHVPDIYASSLYTAPDDDPAKVRKSLMIGPFGIDVYEYPPPFLLLSRATNLLAPDFSSNRMLWFALNGIVILIAMIVVARSLGPIAGTRALLLAPMVWAALPMLNTFQKGNIQLMIIAIAMLAMVLLKKQRLFSGGLLLAYAIAGKIYPGMLLVYLIVRRRWRAVAFTIAWGIVLVLITLLITGWDAYIAFLHHLPRLLSGEAFPAFRNPSATAINLSIPGIVFKLKLFGVQNMSFGVAKIVGWIYTLVLLAVIAIVARRSLRTGDDSPLVWMAILILATLRSPFLPQSYGNVPAIWLLTLLAATYAPNRKTLSVVILAWISLNIIVPTDWGVDPRRLALINALPQTVTIAVAVWGLWRWNKITVPISESKVPDSLNASSEVSQCH